MRRKTVCAGLAVLCAGLAWSFIKAEQTPFESLKESIEGLPVSAQAVVPVTQDIYFDVNATISVQVGLLRITGLNQSSGLPFCYNEKVVGGESIATANDGNYCTLYGDGPSDVRSLTVFDVSHKKGGASISFDNLEIKEFSARDDSVRGTLLTFSQSSTKNIDSVHFENCIIHELVIQAVQHVLGASPNSAAVVFHPYVLSLSISGESHLHSISGVLGAIANAGSEIQASVSGNALLENNVASDGGGCFYSTFDAVLTFSGNATMRNNTSPIGGIVNADDTIKLYANDTTSFVQNNGGIGAILSGDNVEMYASGNSVFADNYVATGSGLMRGYYTAELRASENAEFINNTCASGGAIVESGDVLMILQDNVRMIMNTAGQGGVAYSSGDVTVHASGSVLVANNTASLGGFVRAEAAISLNASGNAAFLGNQASFQGGALYADGKVELLAYDYCTFADNRAGDSGGVVRAGPEADIELHRNASFLSNSAGNSGGVVWHHGTCSMNVYHESVISDNSAGARGGVVCGSITDDTEFLHTSIIGHGEAKPVLRSNHAGLQGGCVYTDETSPSIVLHSLRFESNHAASVGGVVYYQSSSFSADGAYVLDISNCEFVGNSAKDFGGSIYISGEVHVEGVLFEEDFVEDLGGSIYVAAQASINIMDVQVTNVHSGADGGFIYVSEEGTVQIQNVVANSSASDAGGFVFIAPTANASIVDSQMTCWATQGGCILAEESSMVTLRNVSSGYSYSLEDGGFLFLGPNAVATVTSCDFMSAADDDGGFCFMSASSVLDVANSTLQAIASDKGGLVQMSVESQLLATNLEVAAAAGGLGGLLYVAIDGFARLQSIQARALGDDEIARQALNYTNKLSTDHVPLHGGSIYAEIFSHVSVIESSFEDFAASSKGGFLFLDAHSTCHLEKAMISTAQADYGGGIFAADNTNFTFDDVHLYSCNASQAGGGVYFDGSVRVELRSMVIEGCSAGGNGGAMFLDDSVSVDLSGNCSMVRNIAANGAAVYVDQQGTLLGCEGCKMLDNWALTSGGAMYVSGIAHVASARMEGNTAVGGGGAVFVDRAQLHLSDVTMVSNFAQSGGAVYLVGDALVPGDLHCEGCTMEDNAARCEGAAITMRGQSTAYLKVNSFAHGTYADSRAGNLDGIGQNVCKSSGGTAVADVWVADCDGSDLEMSTVASGRLRIEHQDCGKHGIPLWLMLALAIPNGLCCIVLLILVIWQSHKAFVLQRNLLMKALPFSIAKRLQTGERVVDSVDNACIVFADIVDYTAYSSSVTPERLVEVLDSLFNKLDGECATYRLLKVKTVGDCYMAAAGVLDERLGEAESLLRGVMFAWRAISTIEAVGRDFVPPLKLRVGLHVGKVTAGVIGRERLLYDLWGDTVNVAARLEAASEPNRVALREDKAQALGRAYPGSFQFSEPIEKHMKGKGTARVCLVEDVLVSRLQMEFFSDPPPCETGSGTTSAFMAFVLNARNILLGKNRQPLQARQTKLDSLPYARLDSCDYRPL